MAAERIAKWLQKRRRDSVIASIAWSWFAGMAGVVAFLLTFLFVRTLIFWTAGRAIRDSMAAERWSLWLTGLLAVFAFIDSYRSSRADINPPGRWLLREIVYIGPRLMLSAMRHLFRIVRLWSMNINDCSQVLAYLAARNKSVARDELLRAFPLLVWSQLIDQLLLIEGVLFFRTDMSRVSLIWPLRQELRNYAADPSPAPPPRAADPSARRAPEPEPEVVPDLEPMGHHEILGISSTATLAEIKTAYRQRIKECHPDRFSHASAELRYLAEEWTKSLNLAYAALIQEHANRARQRRPQ